ncbi:uncharacterized protein [Epargyreus clarus]|uniref:uncharacterized protein n=1 Tax=Epargyreus clarus TaxID=520877 RepID=UPI003C2E402E
MTRRKSACLKWTLILVLVIFCPYVCSRPQEQTVVSSSSLEIDKPTENPIRDASTKIVEEPKKTDIPSNPTATVSPNTARDVKNKAPVIGESIKMVASQLLEKPSNRSDTAVVIDTRIPPKLKTQLAHKHKIKTRNEDGDEPIENSHAGVAVPVTMEELETENKLSNVPNESSTSNEGISTWILLSNPASKDNSTASTEPTKVEEPQKKQKPTTSKNKTKRPQTNKTAGKRPIIGSTNKSDLVAGGSAINENVYNKIKDTVLSNVQKNKNIPQRTTTTTTTTVLTTEAATTRREVTKAPTSVSVVKGTSKPKKNKNKQKTTTTEAPMQSDSAMLPMEPKEQEIELEVSTPATTTKKPKRSSTRKKTKTKKRKTSKPKPEAETAVVAGVKAANKTKSTKVSKKPVTTPSGPITTQIYNYLSREVMPSVGVGVLGLASLVGIASYFLYPFTTPVRRTFEVDKKDDIYRNNAEEYASEGNGQAEEEMLGTVLAGMPAHSKQKLNPYAAQTPHVNRYQVKKDQDIRYRQVATKYEPNYNVRYPQQKTGIAHAAVYAEPVNYHQHPHQHHQYETRHAYTTEVKYDKGPSSYAPYPAVEPIYAAPQTGPSGLSAYGSDSNSVVYGVKPSSDSDFKPVYPYEAQFYSETTSSPVTYSPTSMYLGSNNEEEEDESDKYTDDSSANTSSVDNKFVVGNVPKELTDSVTPAVVPEHGPRNLQRRRRNLFRSKRSITGSIEELLKAAKENKDVFLSNEIDEALGLPTQAPSSMMIESMAMKNMEMEMNNVIPVYAVSMNPPKEMSTDILSTIKTEVIESVSTVPFDKQEKTTETEMSNDLDVTTKAFRVYEVFSSSPDVTEKSSSLNNEPNAESTTQSKSMNTETTTEFKSETTSTMPPSPSTVSEFTTTVRPTPTYPDVITYPPLNQEGGFFSFLKRLVEFKYRLGLSILQSTSESLNRYLRSMEDTVQKVAKASH